MMPGNRTCLPFNLYTRPPFVTDVLDRKIEVYLNVVIVSAAKPSLRTPDEASLSPTRVFLRKHLDHQK